MRITREMCSCTSMITPLIGQRGEGIRSFRYCRALEFVLRSRGDAETADTAAETTDVLLGSHGARRHSVADAFSKRRQSRSFAALRMTGLLLAAQGCRQRFQRRVSGLSGLLSAATMGFALLAGCELDKTAIPRTNPELALHGVLSASASTQVVLLERTRTGHVSVLAPPFDLGDPVVSDEGIAESGALITLTAPDGSTIVAREDNTTRPDGKGQGIYRFALAGSSLVR